MIDILDGFLKGDIEIVIFLVVVSGILVDLILFEVFNFIVVFELKGSNL